MIAMIEILIARDLAYQADDKSVYFRIKNFPDYGHLAHFDLDELQSTGRVKNDEYDKEHIGDFALWKAWDEDRRRRALGEPMGTRPARAGTSSAARWRRKFWASSSIFIAAAWTTSSRTTKRRSRRPKAAPANNLCATGCIARTCSWTGRKCRSR